MLHNKKILILGGKRVLGRSLVERLAKYYTVTCISRSAHVEQIPSVRYRYGDVNNLSFLTSLADESYDVLIDNLAFDGHHVAQIHKALHRNVHLYILTSTSWVYKFINTTSPYNEIRLSSSGSVPPKDVLPQTVYYVTGKLKAENKASEIWKRCIILRIPIILGENDHSRRLGFIIQRLLDGNPMILVDGGQNKFQVAYARDVAIVYKLLCTSKFDNCKIINIANPETYTTQKFYALCADSLGIPKPKFRKVTSRELYKKVCEYWEKEPFFRERNHILDCSTIKKLFPEFNFSRNVDWLKRLCLLEKEMAEKNPPSPSRIEGELELIGRIQ